MIPRTRGVSRVMAAVTFLCVLAGTHLAETYENERNGISFKVPKDFNQGPVRRGDSLVVAQFWKERGDSAALIRISVLPPWLSKEHREGDIHPDYLESLWARLEYGWCTAEHRTTEVGKKGYTELRLVARKPPNPADFGFYLLERELVISSRLHALEDRDVLIEASMYAEDFDDHEVDSWLDGLRIAEPKTPAPAFPGLFEQFPLWRGEVTVEAGAESPRSESELPHGYARTKGRFLEAIHPKKKSSQAKAVLARAENMLEWLSGRLSEDVTVDSPELVLVDAPDGYRRGLYGVQGAPIPGWRPVQFDSWQGTFPWRHAEVHVFHLPGAMAGYPAEQSLEGQLLNSWLQELDPALPSLIPEWLRIGLKDVLSRAETKVEALEVAAKCCDHFDEYPAASSIPVRVAFETGRLMLQKPNKHLQSVDLVRYLLSREGPHGEPPAGILRDYLRRVAELAAAKRPEVASRLSTWHGPSGPGAGPRTWHILEHGVVGELQADILQQAADDVFGEWSSADWDRLTEDLVDFFEELH